MELRHLRYFIAVAEAGGFGRAGRTLNVTQSALSRQVLDLEEELQVILLTRSKRSRGVRLTEAGKFFFDNVQQVLESLEKAKITARRIQSGKLGSLTIGLVDPFSWHPLIVNSIRTFRKNNPDVALATVVMGSHEQLLALREGRLSGGFVLGRSEEDKDFGAIKVAEDRVLVAASSASHFARHRPKRLAELAREDFFWYPRKVNPVLYDAVVRAFKNSGVEPKLIEGGMNETANLSLVAAGLGCTIVSSQARWRKPRSVVLFPVDDLKVNAIMEFVWQGESPALKNFIQVVTTNMQSRSRRLCCAKTSYVKKRWRFQSRPLNLT